MEITTGTTQKQFFILIGRSGGGKGTQAELLKEYLEKKGHEKVLHITTGGGFRALSERGTYAAELSKANTNSGGFGPEFLAIWVWSTIFIDTLTGTETVILDGAPRKSAEATALHSAITFFGYHNPVVIYLDVSESASKDHIKDRGRDDDTPEGIARRMSWFDIETLPTIEGYLHDPRYRVLHINGNQTIDEVHTEIITKLDLV